MKSTIPLFTRIRDYIENCYYTIKSCFFSQRADLIRGIPRTYMSTNEVMEIFLGNCIIKAVEIEEVFEYYSFDESPEMIQIKKELLEAYDFVKKELPRRLQELDDIHIEFEDGCLFRPFPEENLKLYMKLGDELDALKDKHYQTIVKYRHHLYT